MNTKYADYIKKFIIKAVHIHQDGWITIPYDLVYYEYVKEHREGA